MRWQDRVGQSEHGVRSNPTLARAIARENQEPKQQPLVKVRGALPKLSKAKSLECLTCRKRYAIADLLKGNYQLQTMICSFCYVRMQQQPYAISCFGKPGYTVTPYNPRRVYGYHPHALECRELCPDRVVCQRVVCGSGETG